MTSLLKVTIMFLLAVYAQATDDPTDDDFGMTSHFLVQKNHTHRDPKY